MILSPSLSLLTLGLLFVVVAAAGAVAFLWSQPLDPFFLKAGDLELEMAVAVGEDDMEETEEEHSVVGLDFCGTTAGITWSPP